jgi:hypothetical protein
MISGTVLGTSRAGKTAFAATLPSQLQGPDIELDALH